MDLTARQLATFASVADTLVAPIAMERGAIWPSSASDLGIPGRLGEIYELLPGDGARRDLRRLLNLLDSRAGGLALYGRPRRFTRLTPADAEAALRRMATSRNPQTRQAFQALKRFTAVLLTTAGPGSPIAPLWADTGYPGPDGPAPSVAKAIAPVEIDAPTTWETDVVIVGSGAGGGTAAGVLTGAGLDVVVLEKGPYRNEADFSHVELEALRDLYLDAGLGTTSDLGIGLLAGSNLGGGTTINWTTSFATPERVRAEWDQVSGLRGVFTGTEYEASSQAVHARLGINTDHNFPSSTDELMDKGLRGRGWHVAAMPRNVAGCTPEACGYCGFGCRLGAKRGTLRTYLEDAAAAGARIVVGAEVERIELAGGAAHGVTARVGRFPLEVRAKAVVIAAGALNTPALLLRSGLDAKAVGRNLRLHPVTAVWGRFEERVEPWTGILQSVYSDEFADLDGRGYGFKFETGPVHPVFPAVFFGWESSRRFKELVLSFPHWSPVGILLRDRDSGRVEIDKEGRPVWKYRMSRRDAKHMREGVRRASEVLATAGAVEVLAPTAVPVTWAPGSSVPLDRFLDAVDSVGYGPNQMSYLSFHQMGSARMGTDSRRSVVGADNEAHDVRGLYVMDGSCFPTASGANPMTSIQTIAHRGATRLADRLA